MGSLSNLNSILIEGNMVRDPLYEVTDGGVRRCRFCIVSYRAYTDGKNLEQEVSFFDVVTAGDLADACKSKGHKSRGVRVVGRLKQDRWDGEEGRVYIVAEHVEFRPEFSRALIKEGVEAGEPDQEIAF